MNLIYKKKFKYNELVNFRKISQDNNKLHFENKISDKTPFKKPVVYAALIIKFVLQKILINQESVEEISAMFFKPILVNENIFFRINKTKNKANIIITNGVVNKASLSIDYVKGDNLDQKNIFKNLNLISRTVGNFRKNLNIISFINIKKSKKIKNKIIFKKKINNNYVLLSFYKNLENSINFISYPIKLIESEKLHNYRLKFNKKFKLKKTNKKILIIGGSSGLGNILAQYFLSRGIRPTLTFNKKNIKKTTSISKLKSFKFNENSSTKKFDNLENFEIIYFFPTPEIFTFTNQWFEYKKYKKFNDIYINFFIKIIKVLMSSKIKHNIFVPSSVMISNPLDSIEYAVSKKSTEHLLSIINKNCKNIKIHSPRLGAYYTSNTKFFLNINKNYDNFIEVATRFI